MKKSIYTAVAFLFVAIACANAQNWTLGECIDYAIEHNITIQQSALNVDQKEIDLNTAKSRRLPGVSAGVSENLSFGRGLTEDNTYSNSNTTNTYFQLGADLPIFQGFDINNDIKMSQLNLDAAIASLAKAKDDISVAVAQAFVQILYDREILEVALTQVEKDSLQTERIKAIAQAGKASASEIAAQQATLEQSRLSAVQAKNNLNLAILDLSQLLELETPEGFNIIAPDDSRLQLGLLMSPEAIFDEAVSIKPVIKNEEIMLEYAKVNVERAKGGYLPRLSMSGGIGTNYYTNSSMPGSSFGSQLDKNFSQYVGLSLSVPIFNRFNTRNSVKSAKISLANQQLQLDNTKKNLFKEIQQAYYNAVASQAKCKSSESASQSAEQSYELIREKYENGKANIAEYNDARSRFLEARSNFLQARYECLFLTKLLDFYRGERLDL